MPLQINAKLFLTQLSFSDLAIPLFQSAEFCEEKYPLFLLFSQKVVKKLFLSHYALDNILYLTPTLSNIKLRVENILALAEHNEFHETHV